MSEQLPSTSVMDLDDDTVKLVAYTIVSLKRGKERVMPKSGDTLVITQRMTEQTFTGYVVALYVQSDAYKSLLKDRQFEERDQKYLRVDYKVTRRWPRLPLEFEERQIEALEDINNALK